MSEAQDTAHQMALSEGIDIDAIRVKYRTERDKRLRGDGLGQYIRTEGKFAHFSDEPHRTIVARDPIEADVEVLVIGAGMGGLMVGAKLRELGCQVRLLDDASDVGGTWYWNKYPGAQCDIDSYIYLPFLEKTGYIPSQKYVTADEIRGYLRQVAIHYDLYDGAIFQTRAEQLRWLEDEQRWLVNTNRGDVLKAKYVVSVIGVLHRPKLPGIPGIDTFQGHMFHTSRWDFDYTGGNEKGGMHKLADKRVALIGTGATSVQVAPFLGESARHLYVVQRTPSSVATRGQKPTDHEWASSLQPGWQRQRMRNFLTLVTGGHQDEDLVNDSWTDIFLKTASFLPVDHGSDRTPEQIAAVLELADIKKMAEVRDRVDAIVEDAETAEALKPWYRMWCKRPTFSDTYLDTFNRSNVTLLDTDGNGVERITEHEIWINGKAYEVDCIVFATGFEMGTPYTVRAGFEVYGRGGATLSEHWRDGLKTLHGFYSHGFPNLFHIGVGQNASGVNYNDLAWEFSEHIAETIKLVREKGMDIVEPTAEAEAEWVETCRLSALDLKGFYADCTPGYLNNEGNPKMKAGFRSDEYGGGPLKFFDMIKTWRCEGGVGLTGISPK